MNYSYNIDDWNHDVSGLDKYYGNLPEDTYTEGGFRFRRFSKFNYNPASGSLTRCAAETFTQGKDINNFLGDIVRTYEEVEEGMLTQPVFRKMFELFYYQTRTTKNIGVHQMRYRSYDTIPAAPEGPHQDGFDWVGMTMVKKENLSEECGGVHLFAHLGEPAFEYCDMTNKFVVVNDRELYHDGTNLSPIDSNKELIWDVMVLTSNK